MSGSNVITDASGNVQELMDYYPFGGIRLDEKQGTFNVKKKFTGHYYDADTSLNYMGARYQDGRIGRFISQDQLSQDIGINNDQFKQKYGKELNEVLADPQSLNSYSYVKNNPLRYVDPTGGYGEDVHLDLTYYLGRISGLNIHQSATMAFADQNMDDSLNTSPTDVNNVLNGTTNKYHFADRLETLKAIRQIIDNRSNNADDLHDFGALLHTFQDTYSHAGLGPLSHFFRRHEPDYTYSNSEKALNMAKSSFSLLRSMNAEINGIGKMTRSEYNAETAKLWGDIQENVKNYLSQQDKSKTSIDNYITNLSLK